MKLNQKQIEVCVKVIRWVSEIKIEDNHLFRRYFPTDNEFDILNKEILKDLEKNPNEYDMRNDLKKIQIFQNVLHFYITQYEDPLQKSLLNDREPDMKQVDFYNTIQEILKILTKEILDLTMKSLNG